jgi:hypothetical protein
MRTCLPGIARKAGDALHICGGGKNWGFARKWLKKKFEMAVFGLAFLV